MHDNRLTAELLLDKVMAVLDKRLSVGGTAASEANSLQAGQEVADSPRVEREVTDKPRAEKEVPASATAPSSVPKPIWPEGMDELLSSTPSRIGVWRAGTRPLTKEMLKFRCDHAAAVDSIYGEVNRKLLDEFGLFTVETCFENTEHYLKRPDKGRVLSEEGVSAVRQRCAQKPQVQIVVSDGLSANAIDANLRDVYPALRDSLEAYGLKSGTPFFVRGGRVACMDHIGEMLQPETLVLLIGERPGLVSSKSMSAYMCYRPRKGTVESDRTVISNIHHGGTPPVEAGAHIGTVLKKMLEQRTSGVNLDF
ncbi:ethanolamine ammonia-lyase subunit EutC [Paenibacillus sp. MBLB4367]|uniref:ethanolamine ammonia-lyase subunit EutC n=1 Tax=Paenibacillus sp. MBLB4367 TaxID=3384767 RepID=UPI0039080E88